MSTNDPNDPQFNQPRVERPRVEPEIIPPGASSSRGGTRGGFESIFVRVEEGDDGIRRIHLKKPGPFTVIGLLLAAGVAVALFFVVLAGLVLLWIPLVIAGVLFALFSGSAANYWGRLSALWKNGRNLRP